MTTLLPTVPPDASVLAPFVDRGVFGPAEVHLAAAVARLSPGATGEVLLGLALAARGPRLGHVCVELAQVHLLAADADRSGAEETPLPWPDPAEWAAALAASDVVATPETAFEEPLRPLVWDGRRLYLQRYWQHEDAVANDLTSRATAAEAGFDPFTLASVLDPLFDGDEPGRPDLQRRAAQTALTHGLSVIAGGPGTGKTRTIARLLAAAHQLAAVEGTTLRVALAAPTGKAAARMTEAVRAAVAEASAGNLISDEIAAVLDATEATTLHRLLGSRGGLRFAHDRRNPLPHDLVVVDETSMVALPLMARLLAATRPSARLVLVGDSFQLASVEAGTVMGDVAGPSPAPDGGPLSGRVTVLDRVRRFEAGSGIAALADAIRSGDVHATLALLDGSRDDVAWVPDTDSVGRSALTTELVDAAVEVVDHARDGDASGGLRAASRIKLLAATRHRPLGLYEWSNQIESGVAARGGVERHRRWYVGRPIIVTANDHPNSLANGDVGLVVRHDDGVAVAFDAGGTKRFVTPSRLDHVETWWAMTIHKSQGSEFAHAVVSLPDAASPILTRELLYTAVTRARQRVTLVGSEASIVAAIERPVARASGLRDRLWPQGT